MDHAVHAWDQLKQKENNNKTTVKSNKNGIKWNTSGTNWNKRGTKVEQE